MKQVKVIALSKAELASIMTVAPNGRVVHTHMDLFRDQTIPFCDNGMIVHGHPGQPKQHGAS
jgi:hypothetical protein